MSLEKQHVIIHETDRTGILKKIYPQNEASDVQVSPTEKMPAGVSTAKDVFDNMGSLAFKDSITIPESTVDGYGVVKLSNETNNTTAEAETTAATTKAVSTVSEESVKKNGDETINGIKTFENGLKVGGVSLVYSEAEKTLTIGV